MEKRSGISLYRRNAVYWNAAGAILKSLHVVLGILATLLSLAVSAKPHILNGMKLDYGDLAFLAAACTAILTFLNARDAGDRYAAAGRHLEDAIGKYDIDKDFYFYQVANARSEGAEIIGNGLK